MHILRICYKSFFIVGECAKSIESDLGNASTASIIHGDNSNFRVVFYTKSSQNMPKVFKCAWRICLKNINISVEYKGTLP